MTIKFVVIISLYVIIVIYKKQTFFFLKIEAWRDERSQDSTLRIQKRENSRLGRPEIEENREKGGTRRREREEEVRGRQLERENAKRLRDQLVSMAS